MAFPLSRTLTFTRSPLDGAEFARRAMAEIGPEFEDARRSLLAVETMTYYFGIGGEEAVTELERFRAGSSGDGPGTRQLQSMASLDWIATGGSPGEAAALARESLADGALIEADNGLFTVPAYITLTYTDQQDVLAMWDLALSDAHRRGSLFGLSAAEAWRAFTLFYMGELVESVELHERAYRALRSYGHEDPTVVYMVSFHTRALIEMGELARAREVFEQIGEMPPITGDGPRYQAWARIELLLAEGRSEEALAACDELDRRIATRIVTPMMAPRWSLRARALAALGRGEEGIPLAEEEVERARESGYAGTLGVSLRVLGELKGDAGVDHLREAVDVLGRSLRRLERAKALASLGAVMRRSRRQTEAREPLRQALELADACGARPLVEFARTELYASGARPRSDAASGVAALTASERRVAGLAAGGESNGDIAQALFVTPKTVEVHLSNTYRKLGIKSRRELPAELVG
jgi:ATP/maltotriose-dependent transcriptional regulator MalT